MSPEVAMPGADAKSVATSCLKAWTSGDFATTRALLDDEVTFVGPLGTTEGADAYVSGVQGFAQMITSADVHKVIGDGDDVCIVYDLVTTTPAGTVPTAGWYHLRDGKIVSIRVFFDARPFEAPAGGG
jgi:ketosteroid isomerase-like protein